MIASIRHLATSWLAFLLFVIFGAIVMEYVGPYIFPP
jgi:hypothetical protein